MNVDYGMKEVEGRIARFKLYFKTDIIKSELYNLYDDEPIKENILIEKIHDEHNFSEDFIKNKLQDIAFSSQSSIIKRGAEYKIMTDK
jgi:xanthine dehydrogenase molybdopterin-binding subunit B